MSYLDCLIYAAFVAVMLAVAWRFLPLLRHSFRLEQSPGWPTATATVVSGTVGPFTPGRGPIFQGAFMTYRYSAEGAPFDGMFVLSNESGIRLKQTMAELIGQTIEVRFNRRKPSVSILNDFRDKRFGDLEASQNPLFLRQAPVDSLDEAINRM
jgi:hypothetical protein